jgi:hypothetical protein
MMRSCTYRVLTYEEHGRPKDKAATGAGVAEKPQRCRPDCHNLHGVKQRGISASKVWRGSSDPAGRRAEWWMTRQCSIESYLFRSKAHESCYPAKNPR